MSFEEMLNDSSQEVISHLYDSLNPIAGFDRADFYPILEAWQEDAIEKVRLYSE